MATGFIHTREPFFPTSEALDSPNRLWIRNETRRAANDVNNRHINMYHFCFSDRQKKLCSTFAYILTHNLGNMKTKGNYAQ